MLLRRELFRRGLRFRKNVRTLPGCPDIVFVRKKIAVFCDGDFWHGKDWEARRRKLARGTNAAYWLAKVERNMQRDREHEQVLFEIGWRVIRIWESRVIKNLNEVADELASVVSASEGHSYLRR